MKKYIVLLAIVACMLSGCHREGSWEFQYDQKRVTEIKLVEILDGYSYSVIKELDISCASEIYSDVESLPWEYYGPNLSAPYGVCFLIMFDTGEYDIISYKEPTHYRMEDGKVQPFTSWLSCDIEAFEAILSKYQ